jgi:hypothetical protein
MPKDVYESLNLWKLSEGGEEISFSNNATIFPIGVAKGIYTKVLGRMVSTDYLVIEYVGKGQITLGRSLLKLLGVVIDVGKGNIRFISPPCNSHVFPRVKSKGKKGRRKASADPSTSSLDITCFAFPAPSSKALKKALLGDNSIFLLSVLFILFESWKLLLL